MTAALSSIPVIALSSVPGTNVFAGFIKFFVYWNKQDELKHDLIYVAANATGSMSVDGTGKKVAVVAKETLDQIESDVSNLKWFSLLQMIPLIGIIGVIFEQRILHATVTVNQPQNDTITVNQPQNDKMEGFPSLTVNQPQNDTITVNQPQNDKMEGLPSLTVNQPQTSSPEAITFEQQPKAPNVPTSKGQQDLNTKNVITLTDANYKNFIGPGSKGTVFVLFHGSSWSDPSKYVKKIFDEVAANTKDSILAEVEDKSGDQDTVEVLRFAKIAAFPIIKAYKDGQEIGTFTSDRTVEKITEFINKMMTK